MQAVSQARHCRQEHCINLQTAQPRHEVQLIVSTSMQTQHHGKQPRGVQQMGLLQRR